MIYDDPVWIQLFSGTTGTGTPLACNGAKQVAVEFEWAAGCAAGNIVLEHASHKDYAGVWSQLTSEGFKDGADADLFTFPGPMGFIRARTTVNVSGGGAPGVIVRAKRSYLAPSNW